MKLESLILLLTQKYLTPKILEKHCEKLKEYKENKTYANDIETGNLTKIQ